MKKIIFLFLCISAFAAQLKAGWILTTPARIGSQGSTCTTFSNGNTVRAYDALFQTDVYPSPTTVVDNKVVNRVVLGINRDCTGPFTGFTSSSSYVLEVDITVRHLNYSQATTWIADGNNIGGPCSFGSCTKTVVQKTLRVEYNPAYQTFETELSFFSFEGGYDVEVTVDAMRLNGSAVSTSPNNVYIENLISIDRYKNLDLIATTSLTFTPGPITLAPFVTADEGRLTIVSSIPGAESYDIEWMFLDLYSGDKQVAPNIRRFAFDFKNNATRVTTKSMHYKVPLIYPEGVLLFRVRANGVNISSSTINGPATTQWFGPQTGLIDLNYSSGAITPVSSTPTVYGYYTTGYSKGLTWQHSVSFAEEGKKKQVISYFDGSLYNKQSITKNNSDETSIVGQSIYDFSGRPAVQILPAPVPSTNAQDHDLDYRPNFNQTNDPSRSGKTYNYQDFDIDAANCTETRTSSLSNTSGTEKYYSANNPFTTVNRDRIPQAEGYGFTQTEFMPDNTGRIRRQGGVGPTHRLSGKDESGSTKNGKETRYFYGVPQQVYLDRLFANEAGLAERYKRNIVVDPNGQVSVSYIDPMGRVVATALGGNPTNSPNMQAVAGRNVQTLTVDLIEKNNRNYTESKITSETDYIVLNENTDHKFWYRLAIPMLNYECGEHTFCFDCIYDLNISIVDECGVEYVPSQYQNNKVGLSEPEHTCGDSLIFSTSGYFQITLDQGAYKIRRTLTVDREALEDYIQQMLASTEIENCITPYEDLLTEEKGKLDYTSCEYTCDKCTTDANNLYTAGKITEAQKTEMLEACKVFCYETTPCDALYQQMIIDVSPGGQYFDNIQAGFPGADYILNIEGGIIEQSALPDPPETWMGYLYGLHGGSLPLLDDGGIPGILTNILVADGITGVSIATWEGVRAHWNDKFSAELVKIHPEYCVYEKCKDIEDSYKYDQQMANIETAAEAISSGFYNPTNMTVTLASGFPNPSNLDPFFAGAGASYKTSFESGLTSYKTISSTTYNAWQFVDYVVTQQGSDIEGCLTDYGWNMFRAIYLAKKQEKLADYYKDGACGWFDFSASVDFFVFSQRFILDGANLLNTEFGSIPTSSTPSDYTNIINAKIEEKCEQACSSYIAQWKRELMGCGLSATEMNTVIARMLDICKDGCDSRDPVGSRFAKPGSSLTYKSFREAIGSYYNPGVCDDLLVSWPRGNYHDYWAELTPYHNRCGCLPNQQGPTPGHSCTTCTETLTPNGRHIYENVMLSDDKACKNCITCANLAEALKELDLIYSTTFTADTDNKRKILENYFNLKFSFNLTYMEYVDFMRDCSGLTSIDANTLGDFREVMDEFVERAPIVFEGNSLLMQEESMGGGFEETNEDTTGNVLYGDTLQPVDSIGFGDTTEGGGYSMLSAPPPGFASLDACACGMLMDAKAAFDAMPIKPLGCTTFKDYMNSCSNSCEGQWGTLNVDLLLQTCKNALEKDEDNTYSSSGFTWSFIQLNNLEDMASDNALLIAPNGCVCAEEPDDDFIEYVDRDCDDCTLNAIAEFMGYLEMCVGGQLYIDGSPATKGEMYDFFTKKRASVVTTSGYPTHVTILTSNCAIVDWEQFYTELNTHTNVFASGTACMQYMRSYIENYRQRNGCVPPTYQWSVDPQPCPDPNNPECIEENDPTDDWPFGDPPVFCNTCYKPDVAKHTAVLNFMNQLTAPHKPMDLTADNLLTASGWDVDVRANDYLDPIFYSGTCTTSLRYKLLGWQNNKPATIPPTIPAISFKVTDASGGGGCTHESVWTLVFPNYEEEYKFGNIVEFTEILPVKRPACYGDVHEFLIAANIYDPVSAQVINVKYIRGYVSTVTLYEEDAAICKKLCNKPILPEVAEDTPCEDFLDRVAESNAAYRYEQQILDLREQFTNQYLAKCMSAYDYFRMEHQLDEYHYTLYYYDQGDNLIKTVPPKGVMLLNAASVDSVVKHREGVSGYGTRIKPNHNYITNYKYNTLNQLVEQTTPDAGTSMFWYDKLGRIVLSQNAQQATYLNRGRRKYSYTMYDRLGRIIEAGELQTTATVTPENTASESWVATNIDASSEKTQITRTYYDVTPAWQAALAIPGFSPANLRNRVVATCFYETYMEAYDNTTAQTYNHATHYAYDVLGNVHHLVQDIPQLEAMAQRYKHIRYMYDLASGNVNLVAYQAGHIDQLFHYYKYDADNRITNVYTATNPGVSLSEVEGLVSSPDFIPGFGWQQDAKYYYYLHGPLARMETGQNKVQGTDYSYTIHGWLKAVNDGLMQNANDPGLDGNIPSSGTNPNRWNGRDVAGLELGYYHSTATITHDDYNAIGNNGHISTKTGSNFKETQVPLYNGNINHTVTTLPNKAQIALNNVVADPLGTNYQYDQLNRLKESINYTNVNTGTNSWQNTLSVGTIPQQWQMKLNYDPMGNITHLLRHAQGGAGVGMDSLNYTYNNSQWTNQLTHVDDIITTGAHTEDIDDQAANNYDYDEIGNLIKDDAEEIQTIEWTVYGKIKKITRTATSTKPDLEFEYNSAGQRVVKRVIDNTNNPEIVPYTTYYVRDASGNIIAVYRDITDINDPDWPGEGVASATRRFIIEDWLLYGSSRLGIYSASHQLATVEGFYEYDGDEFTPIPETFIPGNLPADGIVTYFTAGKKHYELTNHLGNVLATYTDRKVPSINAVTGSFNFFNAQITTVTDYYPFGMQIEERSWSAAGSYRFGFNGKESDNEVSGSGNQYDYGFRIYNPRIGKFLSVDPLKQRFPWWTPYQFAGNSPITFRDLDGLEPEYVDQTTGSKVQPLDNGLRVQLTTPNGITTTGNGFGVNNTIPIGEVVVADQIFSFVAKNTIGSLLGLANEVITGINDEGEKGNRATASGKIALELFGGKLVSLSGKSIKWVWRSISELLSNSTLKKTVIVLGRETAEEVVENTSRLQHAYKHADDINQFKGKKNFTAEIQKEWRDFNKNILENPDNTFVHKIGNDDVIGFHKLVDGQNIGVFVYRDGDKAGQLATTFVMTEQQLINAGIK